jgi:hypothetical protein
MSNCGIKLPFSLPLATEYSARVFVHGRYYLSIQTFVCKASNLPLKCALNIVANPIVLSMRLLFNKIDCFP